LSAWRRPAQLELPACMGRNEWPVETAGGELARDEKEQSVCSCLVALVAYGKREEENPRKCSPVSLKTALAPQK